MPLVSLFWNVFCFENFVKELRKKVACNKFRRHTLQRKLGSYQWETFLQFVFLVFIWRKWNFENKCKKILIPSSSYQIFLEINICSKSLFFIPMCLSLQVEKTVFVVFFSGEQARNKVLKICEAFGANCYPVPEDVTKQRQITREVSCFYGRLLNNNCIVDLYFVFLSLEKKICFWF